MSGTALVDSTTVDADLDLVIGEIEQEVVTPRGAEATTCARIYCGP